MKDSAISASPTLSSSTTRLVGTLNSGLITHLEATFRVWQFILLMEQCTTWIPTLTMTNKLEPCLSSIWRRYIIEGYKNWNSLFLNSVYRQESGMLTWNFWILLLRRLSLVLQLTADLQQLHPLRLTAKFLVVGKK